MQTNYHNTNSLVGEEIKERHTKAHSQQKDVLALYEKYSSTRLSASEVYSLLGCQQTNTPITSIRRCITNLMNKGLLVKLSDKRKGMYGHPESFYQYKTIRVEENSDRVSGNQNN
jgi:Fe2+ or Zn2+ uptake regulation protein